LARSWERRLFDLATVLEGAVCAHPTSPFLTLHASDLGMLATVTFANGTAPAEAFAHWVLARSGMSADEFDRLVRRLAETEIAAGAMAEDALDGAVKWARDALDDVARGKARTGKGRFGRRSG
jgi:hypothetical protein